MAGHGNGGKNIGYTIKEIMNRLQAIQPEAFIAPSVNREDGAPIICFATDGIKRLFTLRAVLVFEQNLITSRIQELDLDPARMPGSDSQHEHDEMTKMLLQLKPLRDIIDHMLRLEVWSHSIELLTAQPKITLYSDWGIACQKEDGADDVLDFTIFGTWGESSLGSQTTGAH